MIGRHHARLLQASARVAFAGAVDPGGRRSRRRPRRRPGVRLARRAAGRRHAGLRDRRRARPTTTSRRCASSSRPACTCSSRSRWPPPPREAREIIESCAAAGVHGAVGHVERFNPALLELRRRVQDGQLGEVFLIATERVGPFPDRVRDVGVVKDLATHDLDLVRWLGASPGRSGSPRRPQHRWAASTRTSCSSPAASRAASASTPSSTGSRRRRSGARAILGERGMLVADTLTADLTFFANGAVRSGWHATRRRCAASARAT